LNIVKHQSHDVSCDWTLNIVNHQSHDVSRDSVSLHIYHTHFGTWELYMGCDFLMTFLIVDKINNLI
jgi:hypothetical protein